MTTAEQISDRVIGFLGRRTMLSTGTREELREIIASEFSAVAPRQQPSLDFTDVTAGRHGGNRQSLLAAKDGESRRPNQRTRIWTWLHERADRGGTVEEISIALDIRYTTVSARAAEMKTEGIIKESGRTRETETKSLASVLVVI